MPPQDQSTIYGLIGIAIGCVTVLILGWKFINEYFTDKKDNNQAFVERVVASTVATILNDFKTEFHQFREQTNAMQKEFNTTVLNIYKEMKK